MPKCAMPKCMVGPEIGEPRFARFTPAGKWAAMDFRKSTRACWLDSVLVAVATCEALAVPLATCADF